MQARGGLSLFRPQTIRTPLAHTAENFRSRSEVADSRAGEAREGRCVSSRGFPAAYTEILCLFLSRLLQSHDHFIALPPQATTSRTGCNTHTNIQAKRSQCRARTPKKKQKKDKNATDAHNMRTSLLSPYLHSPKRLRRAAPHKKYLTFKSAPFSASLFTDTHTPVCHH